MSEKLRLIDLTDKAIHELVHPKLELQKAYNYYNGILDARQYKHLEDNYGLGNAVEIEFIPLIKKHVDSLIGEYLGFPIIPKVSCKDEETISNINRDKELQIKSEVAKFFKSKLQNSILSFVDGKNMTDVNIKMQLDKLIEDLKSNFISEYEIAALNVIQYIMQSRSTDIHTKLAQIMLDTLVGGGGYYRAKSSPSETNVQIDVLDPLNVFPDRNPNSPYVKDSYRIVVRRWLSTDSILSEYGHLILREDKKKLREDVEELMSSEGRFYIRHKANIPFKSSSDIGIDAGSYISPGVPYEPYYGCTTKILPVYEVEWLEADKNNQLLRYKTIRIGEEIYITLGKDLTVVRTQDNPNYCCLSVNGIFLLNRSRKPFSLVLSCASLQDKYNMIHYLRDNVIANSGNIGDYVDVSVLPSWLGKGPLERLMKFISYKKQGIAPIDSAQEGRLATGEANLNTIYNGYDDTIKALTIQAFQLVIESIEQQCSAITGVFRERLNGIEARDAVTNIKIGLDNSFKVTKHYYLQMDTLVAELLTDALNVAKIVYKNGLRGTLLLGDKRQKIFTALPEYFTLSDYDIHILTTTEIIQEMELIKALIPEFIKSQMFNPELIFEALTTKSLSELKYKVKLAMLKLKEENNQIMQLQQQGEELSQQLEQTLRQLQLAMLKIEQLNEAKLKLEQQKIQLDYQVNWYKALTDRTFKNRSNEIDEKKVEAEILQLRDKNPYNDKINFNV